MNLLYIVPYPPDLIRVRPYNLIKSLAEKGHQVAIAALWSNEHERMAVEKLKEAGYQVQSAYVSPIRSLGNCLAAAATPAPFQAEYSWHPGFARQLDELVFSSPGFPEFDIVHVEHLRGVKYGLTLQKQRNRVDHSRHNPVFIWDSVDCISHLFEQATRHNHRVFSQLPTRLDLQRTKRFEGSVLDRYDHVVVTSRADKDALSTLYRGSHVPKISIVPNGVDLTYFSPDPQVQREPATLVISGKMSYHANIAMVLHLVREIMPVVWESRPDVKLCVVGKDPPWEIRGLAKEPRIQVTGSVPDIRPYLRQATMAVAPLVYGAGIQNKVLEAMACGTPVISSPQAVSALATTPGEDIILAESPELFAGAILDLLNDPEKLIQIGQAGRRYVVSHHKWSSIAAQLEDIYEETVELKQNRDHTLTSSTRAIRNNEKNRIARHLHDTLGDDLAYLCLKLDQLSNSSEQGNGLEKYHSEISSMYRVANNAVEHLRNILSELQGDSQAIPSPDLASNINECALLIGARANFHVNHQISGNPITLSPQIQREILYLVREILRNVEKHAHAQNVCLTLNWLENGLAIEISDDGQGFDVNLPQKNEGHYGLRTLREIVYEMKGSLSVSSSQGEGTHISFYLPC